MRPWEKQAIIEGIPPKVRNNNENRWGRPWKTNTKHQQNNGSESKEEQGKVRTH